MTDIILSAVSVASFGGIVYVVAKRVPFLLSIPENIIDESFVVRPPRFKVFADSINKYFSEKRYEIPFLEFFFFIVRKLRILFLKFERIFFNLQQKIKNRRVIIGIPKEKRDYLRSIGEKEENGKNGNGGGY